MATALQRRRVGAVGHRDADVLVDADIAEGRLPGELARARAEARPGGLVFDREGQRVAVRVRGRRHEGVEVADVDGRGRVAGDDRRRVRRSVVGFSAQEPLALLLVHEAAAERERCDNECGDAPCGARMILWLHGSLPALIWAGKPFESRYAKYPARMRVEEAA